MELLAIALFSKHLVNAIGTTLIHSLWQGLILVGVTGLIILTTRSRKPALRYNLLVWSLFAFFILSVATFINAFFQVTSQASGVNLIAHGKENLTAFIPNVTLLIQAKTYLADHNQTVVLLWFLIVAARCFQLLIGLNSLGYLRRNASFTISADWEAKAKSLAQQLGIKQIVRFAECRLIKVPIVIGHLKPLILLPLGLLTALPPKEIEAILVHELAHIYRRDYLVNLLQNVMEILFFFNPAVLWLSSLIKTERENCCDDIAVNLTTSKINYISALIACQEYQQALPAYAMAFSKKGQLRNRVARLVDNNNQSLNGFEKSIFIICMIATGLVFLSIANETKIGRIVAQTTTTVKTAMSVTNEEANFNEDPTKKIIISPKLSRQIDSILPEVAEKRSVAVAEHQELPEIDSITNDSLKALGNRMRIRAKLARLARLDSILAPLSKTVNGPNYKTQSRNYTTQSRNYPAKPSLSDQVKEELVMDGIITKSQSISSFILSAKELIVNGKRQPEEIHQKYRDKYVPVLKKDSWMLYYNYETAITVTTS